ncbi:hypothetical protein ACIPRI_16535 [Variovorax sp. LARHSF232]
MTCAGPIRTLLHTLMFLGLLGSLCASVAAQPLLPPGTYASGGISSEGRAEMRAIRSLYSLHLAFAQAGTGGYIAGLAVSLQHAGQARTTLVCQDCGPLVYIALAPGSYTVIATWEGVSRSQTVRVGATPTQAVLYWPAPPRGAEVIRADPAEAM